MPIWGPIPTLIDTRAQNPKDAIEHATVIYTPNPARFVRQHRLDRNPFIIAEFVAHDSRLPFQNLNHVSGNAINSTMAPGGAANALDLLSLLAA